MIAHNYGIYRNVFAEVDYESIILISVAFWQDQVFFLVSAKYSFWVLDPSGLPLYRGPAILGSKIFPVGIALLQSNRLRKLAVMIFGQNFREHFSHELSYEHQHVFDQSKDPCQKIEYAVDNPDYPLGKGQLRELP